MGFTPRKPQREGRDAFYGYDGAKGAMVVLPTGVGKTTMANWIATDYLDAGLRVCWIAHTIELVTQPYEDLCRTFPEYADRAGLVQSTHNDPDKDIVYCSKQTLGNSYRLVQLIKSGTFDLVIVDECHHATNKSYKSILKVLQGDGSKLLGLTATPDREDGASLGNDWDIVYTYSIIDGIRDGIILQPYAVAVAIPELDLTAVGGRKDYNDKDLWRALAKAHIVEHTLEAIASKHECWSIPFRDIHRRLAVGNRSTLVFTASIEQSILTAEALNHAGYRAAHISGHTHKQERKQLIAAFKRGEIQFLCNSQVLTEGADLPRASVAVLARPTKSWSLYCQMVGRVVRTFDDKDVDDAFILDLAGGATVIHSLVSAPVLIGGSCFSGPLGEHAWMDAGGLGVCNYCFATVPCSQRGGPHRFKEGRCITCGATQCKAAPDFQHHWILWDEARRICLHCAMEIPDKVSSIIGKKIPETGQEKAAWQRLKTPGELWAVNMGRLGILFLRHGTGTDGMQWEPLWWPRMGKPRSLSGGPVSASLAAILSNDVVRKCDKVAGLYGGRTSPTKYRAGYQEAEEVARKFTLWAT